MGAGTCRIHTGTLGGWNAVVLESDRLRVVVLPEKGADIASLVHVPSGTDFLLHAPWGLQPPGSPPREGEILEVIQGAVSVSYRVQWADGRQTLIAPSLGVARIVPASDRA